MSKSTLNLLALLLFLASGAKAQTFPVMQPFDSGLTNRQSDIAYDGHNGVFCVVASEEVSVLYTRVVAQIFDENQAPIGGPIELTTPGLRHCDQPSVALHNFGVPSFNRFSIVWRERRLTGPNRLRMRQINRLGSFASSEIGLAESATEDYRNPSIGCAGDRGLVVFESAATGSGRSDSILARAFESPTAFGSLTFGAIDGLGFAVANQAVEAPRVSKSGVSDAASGEMRFWTAWHKTLPSFGGGETRALRLRALRVASGSNPAIAKETLQSPGDASSDEGLPDLAFLATNRNDSGAVCLMAFESDGDIRGLMLDAYAPLGATFLVLDHPARQLDSPTVGAGGCDFFVGFRRENGIGGSCFASRRVSPNGSPGFESSFLCTATSESSRPRISARSIGVAPIEGNNHLMLTWTIGGPSGDIVLAQRHEPIAAQISALWPNCSGATNFAPQLGHAGGVPYPGNSSFRLTLVGAPADAAAYCAVGLGAGSGLIPGTNCGLYVSRIGAILPMLTDSSGSIDYGLPIPCESWLNDLLVYMQMAVIAPGANATGIVASNGLLLEWRD